MIRKWVKWVYRTVTYPLRLIKRALIKRQNRKAVEKQLGESGATLSSFDYDKYRQRILQFVENARTDNSGIRYKYSPSSSQPTLYSSVYVCMLYSLFGELDKLNSDEKKTWAAYFDSFQREDDGLFYDKVVANTYFDDSDWWGARHLALHIINAYTCLDSRPRLPFRFLERYYDLNELSKWLDENMGMFSSAMENDFDNKLMNIACLLQYQRDAWSDEKAGAAVLTIQQYLIRKINPGTGIWGDDNINDPDIRSRKVQFAYHLLPIFFYDNIFDFDVEKIIRVTLQTQNIYGGFGVPVNSSACEDIDSIDILIRLAPYAGASAAEVKQTLERGFRWVLANQMPDGGFVFRLNEKFFYGHQEMSSLKNEGAMFPTWFRTLSIAYLSRYFNLNFFKIVKCPGL